MKKLVLATLFVAACAHAGATVLNFDDLPSGELLPTSYESLTWSADWGAYSDSSYAGYGNTYGSPSGENAAFNGSGVTEVTVTSGVDFDFNGAYFTGWASFNSVAGFTAQSLTISRYNTGNLIGEVTTSLSANQYDFFAVKLAGIDELRFTQNNGSGHWWLMDNFTFNESAQVPEPVSLALFGIALAGLGE